MGHTISCHQCGQNIVPELEAMECVIRAARTFRDGHPMDDQRCRELIRDALRGLEVARAETQCSNIAADVESFPSSVRPELSCTCGHAGTTFSTNLNCPIHKVNTFMNFSDS